MARIALATQEVAHHGFTHINVKTPEDERMEALVEAYKKNKGEPELPEGATIEDETTENEAKLEQIRFLEPLLNAKGILTEKQQKEKDKIDKENKEALEKGFGGGGGGKTAEKPHTAGNKK